MLGFLVKESMMLPWWIHWRQTICILLLRWGSTEVNKHKTIYISESGTHGKSQNSHCPGMLCENKTKQNFLRDSRTQSNSLSISFSFVLQLSTISFLTKTLFYFPEFHFETIRKSTLIISLFYLMNNLKRIFFSVLLFNIIK